MIRAILQLKFSTVEKLSVGVFVSWLSLYHNTYLFKRIQVKGMNRPFGAHNILPFFTVFKTFAMSHNHIITFKYKMNCYGILEQTYSDYDYEIANKNFFYWEVISYMLSEAVIASSELFSLFSWEYSELFKKVFFL